MAVTVSPIHWATRDRDAAVEMPGDEHALKGVVGRLAR